MAHERVQWPEGRAFAFTVFDDPDAQVEAEGRQVYEFLADAGLRTTKAVWPLRGTRQPSDRGETCDEEPYRDWVLELQRRGFEVAYHNTTLHTSTRDETTRGLRRFHTLFGAFPTSMANHYFSEEGIYWGDARITGLHRVLYNCLTRWKNSNRFRGHHDGDPLFWGDLCRSHIRYVRNFVFADINTLRACPFMPYHDVRRPYVNYWFSGTEGANCSTFVRTLNRRHVDRLVDEGGACIMYTHFGHGFVNQGRLDDGFRRVIDDISRRNGWFVPVSQLLDFLRLQRASHEITDRERSQLERRWLAHKVLFGTA